MRNRLFELSRRRAYTCPLHRRGFQTNLRLLRGLAGTPAHTPAGCRNTGGLPRRFPVSYIDPGICFAFHSPPGIVFPKSGNHASQKAIWSTVLCDDDFCKCRIGIFDFNGILQSLLIDPHYSSSSIPVSHGQGPVIQAQRLVLELVSCRGP